MNPQTQSTLKFYDENPERVAQEALRSRDLAFLNQFQSHLPPAGEGIRVLDAGCGVGQDLVWFKKRGFEVEGFCRRHMRVHGAYYDSWLMAWLA